MYQWKIGAIFFGVAVFALFSPGLINNAFAQQITDFILPDWVYYIVVPLIIAGAGFYFSNRAQKASEKQLKDAETLRKIEFYQTIIKKLSRMLKNPGFTSIEAPESTHDVRMTFREIDDLPLDLYLNQGVLELYEKFRAPWESMYGSHDVKIRQDLVDMIVEFRNKLVRNYNLTIDENKKSNLHKFEEFDNNSFKVKENVT